MEKSMEKLWSVEDVAEYLGVPVATLYQWRTKDYGPKARRVGRFLRYRPQEVESWLDSLTVSTR